jgi:hypothetical protein
MSRVEVLLIDVMGFERWLPGHAMGFWVIRAETSGQFPINLSQERNIPLADRENPGILLSTRSVEAIRVVYSGCDLLCRPN